MVKRTRGRRVTTVSLHRLRLSSLQVWRLVSIIFITPSVYEVSCASESYTVRTLENHEPVKRRFASSRAKGRHVIPFSIARLQHYDMDAL